MLGPIIPAVALPFLVASLIQLAQGSRVVTVVIAAEIMGGYPMDPTTLLFSISAGALVSPFEPLLLAGEGDDGFGFEAEHLLATLPLTLFGLIVFLATVLRWLFFVWMGMESRAWADYRRQDLLPIRGAVSGCFSSRCSRSPRRKGGPRRWLGRWRTPDPSRSSSPPPSPKQYGEEVIDVPPPGGVRPHHHPHVPLHPGEAARPLAEPV